MVGAQSVAAWISWIVRTESFWPISINIYIQLIIISIFICYQIALIIVWRCRPYILIWLWLLWLHWHFWIRWRCRLFRRRWLKCWWCSRSLIFVATVNSRQCPLTRRLPLWRPGLTWPPTNRHSFPSRPSTNIAPFTSTGAINWYQIYFE